MLVLFSVLWLQFLSVCAAADGGYLLYTDVVSTAWYLQSDLNMINHTGDDLYNTALAGDEIAHDVIHDGIGEYKVTFTYDLDDQLVFWKDAYRREIRKMSLSTGETTTIFDGVSFSRGGMAVDWVANILYWSDPDYNWIMMSDYNGTYHHAVVKTGLDEPADVAVDPMRGKLYWADWRGNAGIWVSTLTGENVEMVTAGDTDELKSPYGVTIDFDINRLYWTDIYHEAIFSMSLDNVTDKIVTEYENGRLYYPYYMDLDKDYFFISENYYRRIILVPRNHSVVSNAVMLDTHWTPLGIAFVNTSRQPVHLNPCSLDNGGCDQLCVSAADKRHQCLCTAGYILQDGRCVPDDHLVPGHSYIIADANYICSLPTHVSDKNDLDGVLKCFVYNMYVNTFDYDSDQDMLYVYHPQESAIKRVVLRENSTFETIHSDTKQVTGIALDWVYSNLYWTSTDPDQGGVWVSKLDGSLKTLLLNDVSQPLAIVVDPLQEFIFWSSGGANAAIERASLSGRDRVVLVSSDVFNPVAMALHNTTNRLYWADTGPTSGATESSVHSIGIHGNVRESISVVRETRTFRGLGINQDTLVWTQVEDRLLTFYDTARDDHRRTLEYPDVPGFIKLFDHDLQPKFQGLDPCLLDHNCSSLCLPYHGVADCVCSRSDGNCDGNEVPRCSLTMEHGSIIGAGNETCQGMVGEKCYFTCDGNFLPVGDQEIECLEGGKWDKNVDGLCIFNISLEYFLLVASADGIFYVDMSSPDFPHVKLPLDFLETPFSFDFDYDEEMLYVTDIQLDAIVKTSLDGSRVETFLQSDLDFPDGIVIDKRKRRLFWVDSNTDRVEAIGLDGANRHPLAIYDLDEPRALVLDEREGLLYWTDWGFEGEKIERVDTDVNLLCSGGDSRQTVIYSNLSQPLGLVLERTESDNRLYWCDAARDLLESSGLDGSHRTQIHEFPNDATCFGLALTDDYYIWSDYSSAGGYLHRLHRSTLVDEVFLEDMLLIQAKDVKIFRRPEKHSTPPPSTTSTRSPTSETKATESVKATTKTQTPPPATATPNAKSSAKPMTSSSVTRATSAQTPSGVSPDAPKPQRAPPATSPGAIGGAVAGILVVLLIIALIAIAIRRRRGSAFYSTDDTTGAVELDGSQPPAVKYSVSMKDEGSIRGLENPMFN